MVLKNYFPHFKKALLHPRVFIFMLIGSGVMFLTFLTSNNALEIAISGVASFFIGIGVNNLTSLETHSKDEQKLKLKIGHTLKIMAMIQTRVTMIRQQPGNENCQELRTELGELEQIINLGIDLIREDETLD